MTSLKISDFYTGQSISREFYLNLNRPILGESNKKCRPEVSIHPFNVEWFI